MMMVAANKSRVFGTHHLVSQSGVLLSTTAQSRERVVHAGAHEADEGYHAQLKFGRGIPWQRPEQEFVLRVLPARGRREVPLVHLLLIGRGEASGSCTDGLLFVVGVSSDLRRLDFLVGHG